MRFSLQSNPCRGLLMVVLSGLSFGAFALPRIQDPQLQPLMAAAAGEYQRYLSNPVAFLAVPKEAKPWPCAVTPAELDAFAGIVDSDNDPVLKRQLLSDARSYGTDAVRIAFANKVFTPIKAQCEGGKLSGPTAFWVEFDSSNGNGILTIKGRHLVHVRLTARNGKPEGLVLRTGTTLSSQTVYHDPATAEMMAKNPQPKVTTVEFAVRQEGGGQELAPKVEVSHFVMEGVVTVTTNTTLPRQGGRLIQDTYGVMGGPEHHFSRTHRRNGKLHGPQHTYASMMGTIPIPAETVCWEDGEKVLTTSCTVD